MIVIYRNGFAILPLEYMVLKSHRHQYNRSWNVIETRPPILEDLKLRQSK